eukprot:jgi/Botrbrau1/3324/Bobra.0048s0019.1
MMGSLTGSRCAGIVKDASVAPSLRRTPTLCIAGVRRINLSHSTSRKQAPLFRVSAGEAPLSRGQLQVANSMVEKLTAQELEQGLQDRTMPLIIDFYATWCGPCLLLAKELDELAPEFEGRARFVKIDTDEHPELSSQLEISGLPTMIFVGMDKTKPALRTEGLLPAHVIREIIEKELLPST